MDHELQFYSPWQDTKIWKGFLPHWEQPGASYFITWRLADSIPETKLQELNEEKKSWLANHPQPWSPEDEEAFHQLFSGKIDEWLDAGFGSCLLRDQDLRDLVRASLLFFEGERYVIHSFVIMPNHCHVLVTLKENFDLAGLLHSWKSFSARELNRLRSATGTVWQKEYFDRLVRDGKHFESCVKYIRRNPERARLLDTEYSLFESELTQRIE